MNSFSQKSTTDSSRRLGEDIVIRPARVDDLDQLVALELQSFTTDHLSRAQYRRHIASSSAIVLVAVRGAAVLGSTVAFLRTNSDEARLYSVAVSDSARGQGIGDALVDAIEVSVRASGRRRVRLEVRQDNPSAIRLYERRDYVRFGQIAGFYEDGGDAWCYRKAVAPTR
jgi:ribosomal-protein-alanine N-acetyltransferase